MLIPHLHFAGNCVEAIALYEKAFDTKSEVILRNSEYASGPVSDGDKIAHAAMKIHGQTVFLNDRFGNENKSEECTVHLIIYFENESALLECYQILGDRSITIDPLESLSYSRLAVQFIDRYGIQWGFMVKE